RSSHFLFFFQAEDGIRDFHVTGVQTCALPIYAIDGPQRAVFAGPFVPDGDAAFLQPFDVVVAPQEPQQLDDDGLEVDLLGGDQRSEERRVGKEWWARDAGGACGRSVGGSQMSG